MTNTTSTILNKNMADRMQVVPNPYEFSASGSLLLAFEENTSRTHLSC